MTTPTISLAALRRHVVAHQGFATRLRRARADDVEAAIRRLSCVQLDSISTVERSHRIVLTSRLGIYPPGTVSRLLGEGRVFEYWAHEASLVPVEDFPLFRWRMLGRGHWNSHESALADHPEVVEHVLEEIRARGPLGSRHFEGEGGGGMWAWKPAKRVLDSLWDRGDLSIAGRQGFQRLYDLTERVIPRAVLDAPVPTEAQALRSLVLRAVRGRGALTESGIAEHYRVPSRTAAVRPHVEALEAEGLLRRLRVDDGGPDVLVPGELELGESVSPGATLLSPFDNMLWDRPFAERVFGFKHVMEIYKPAPAAGLRLLRAAGAARRPHRRPRGPEVGPQGRGAAPALVPPRAAGARLGGPAREPRAGARAAGAGGRRRWGRPGAV